MKNEQCQNCKSLRTHVHKNSLYIECGSCGWIQVRETPLPPPIKPANYIGYLKNTLKHVLEMNVESPADNFEEGDGHYELLNEIDCLGRYTEIRKTNIKHKKEDSFFVDMKDGSRMDITITKH